MDSINSIPNCRWRYSKRKKTGLSPLVSKHKSYTISIPLSEYCKSLLYLKQQKDIKTTWTQSLNLRNKCSISCDKGLVLVLHGWTRIYQHPNPCKHAYKTWNEPISTMRFSCTILSNKKTTIWRNVAAAVLFTIGNFESCNRNPSNKVYIED